MTLIDLDRPTASPASRTRKSFLRIVATALVGAVLGASATQARHEAAAQGRHIAVFVFAGNDPEADQLPAGSVVQNGRVATVTLTRHVTFVNAGSAPVNVRDLTAAKPSVSVRGVSKQRWIAPGATARADVDIQVDCAHGLPLTRLPVTLVVQMINEEGQQVRPREGLDVTMWADHIESACGGQS